MVVSKFHKSLSILNWLYPLRIVCACSEYEFATGAYGFTMSDVLNQIIQQLTSHPLDNVKGVLIILVLLGIAIKLSPKGVSIAGHDAGQLFLLAALPLFFIDFGTSAEYAAGELHHVLAESNLQVFAPYGVVAIALLNLAFGGLYIYALGVFRDGGGADTASMRYLGPMVAIMVAFLLLEDYTLTIVVSSLSGADQLLSTVTALEAPPIIHIVLGVGIAWLTCWLTLRGRRDASRV